MIPRPLLTTGKNSLRLALAAGAVGQLLGLPAALAQEPAADVQELTPMMITGSLIPTTDLVGLMPVTSITSVDLVRRGVSTPAEVVRRLPAVVGGNLSESYGNGGDGSSRINLRGIPGGTLVLINGRRVAPVAFAESDVDLNMIPFAAIDRIEVLKDGASATYGSDAIAGVVNIILKKDFEGVEIGAYWGNTTEKDAFRQQYSAVAGTTTDKASFVAGANYYKANSIFSQDRSRSSVNFNTRTDAYPGLSSGTSNPGRFQVRNDALGNGQLYNPNAAPDAPVFVTLNKGATPSVPATVNGQPVLDASGNPVLRFAPGDYHRHGASPDQELYPFDRFPFSIYTPSMRPSERYGVFANGDYKIFDEHLEFFSDALYSNSQTANQLAPTPIVSRAANAIPTPISANNPYNPFGVDIPTWNYRAVEIGPRIDEIDKDAFRYVGGFRGKLPDTETWNWESAFLYSQEDGTQTLNNDVSRSRLGAALGDTTYAAFNPFGISANSPQQVDAVRLTDQNSPLYTVGRSKLWSVDGRVGGEVFDLPAGGIGVAAGGEYREEEGESIPDRAQQTGEPAGFNAASSVIAERSISAAFGEINIPVFSEKWNLPGFHAFNIRGAARYEYYSDFGDDINPAIRFGWQPIDEHWQIYGSFSQSFKAPTFTDLYVNQESYPDVFNNYTGAFEQVRTIQQGTAVAGDPSLAQEADNYLIGSEWRVRQVPGLKLSLDYFRIDRDQVLGGSAQWIMDRNFEGGGPTDPNAPFSNQIQFDPTDNSYSLVVVRQVLVSDSLDGFDISASYDLPTDAFGTFSFATAWQYLLSYEQDIPLIGTVDRLGDYSADEFGYESLPRLKGYGSFFWTYGDFSTGFYANYTGGYLDDPNATGSPPPEVDDYLTFDIQASYNFPYNIKLTAGCLNVTDADPPLVVGSFADQYDRGLVDIRQRFWYVSLGVKF